MQGQAGNERLERSAVGRDLGVLIGGKLDLSHCWQPKGPPCPGGTRSREGLSHSALHWGSLTSSAGGTLGTTRSEGAKAVGECPKEGHGAGEGLGSS